MLWWAAMEGINATRDDVLDLIEEIIHLRTAADFDTLPIPPPHPQPDPTLFPNPWAEEWPGNP